jgi:ubiquinone/menaquinone biosynthesis C-methylase UbiE
MKNESEKMTEQLFMGAGIKPGDKVLDVGCGLGKVTSLISKIVGPTGEVIGIDLNEKNLISAKDNAKNEGLENIKFITSNIDEFSEGDFDAIVGRRVFMYLPDAQKSIKCLTALLKPNGVFAIQEHSKLYPASFGSPMPLHEKISTIIWDYVKHTGADTTIGLKLFSYLTEVGIQVKDIQSKCIIQTPESPYHYGTIIKVLSKNIIKSGVASAKDLDIENIQQRLQQELISTNTCFTSEVSFCIWGRKI